MSPSSSRRYGARRVAIVLSGWPRVSETFALNELLALEEAGMLGAVVATKPGDLALVQPAASRLRTPVQILADGDVDAQGAQLAELVRHRADAVHGYFAHRPAAVARIAARALGVPFGFSAHALDVRKVDGEELRDRATAARCVVACNDDTVRSLAAVGAPVRLLAHGVDTALFRPPPYRPPGRRVELLAVGRLVPKKGFEVLIEAMSLMRAPARLRIFGDGVQRDALEAAIARHGVADRVELCGRCTHAELPALYATADVVVVPSVVDAAGDRDGLPNVVLEAMACARAVIASDVAAIASAVRHDDTGVLVAPGDPMALAAQLDRLAARPMWRAVLGGHARAMVAAEFDLTDCASRFVDALEVAYA